MGDFNFAAWLNESGSEDERNNDLNPDDADARHSAMIAGARLSQLAKEARQPSAERQPPSSTPTEVQQRSSAQADVQARPAGRAGRRMAPDTAAVAPDWLSDPGIAGVETPPSTAAEPIPGTPQFLAPPIRFGENNSGVVSNGGIHRSGPQAGGTRGDGTHASSDSLWASMSNSAAQRAEGQQRAEPPHTHSAQGRAPGTSSQWAQPASHSRPAREQGRSPTRARNRSGPLVDMPMIVGVAVFLVGIGALVAWWALSF